MSGDRAGELSEVGFDPAEQVVALHLHLRVGGVEAEHVLRLEGVRELAFATGSPGWRGRAEVTGLRWEHDAPSGTWAVDLVLWDDASRLRARCDTVRVDGMPVQPSTSAWALPSL